LQPKLINDEISMIVPSNETLILGLYWIFITFSSRPQAWNGSDLVTIGVGF
jgi:hypothetical protein